MKLPVRKINFLFSYVTEILTSQNLTYEDRKNFRRAKDALSDATLGMNTKANHANEIYTEMSKHKAYTEDANKLKELLKEKQSDLEEAMKAEIEFKFSPFDFVPKFDGPRADTLRLYTNELEDYILNIK